MSRAEFDSDQYNYILLVTNTFGETPDDPTLLARAVLRQNVEGSFIDEMEDGDIAISKDGEIISLYKVGKRLFFRYWFTKLAENNSKLKIPIKHEGD